MVFKGIKQALGVGSSDEFYAAALEHLAAEGSGQPRRAEAIRAFEKAAEKADGRPDLKARAEANAALHRFIEEGGHTHLRTLLERMPEARWIERPGDPADRVMADPLVAEIEGRIAAASATSGPAGVAAHEAAAAAFGRCADHRLVTYPHHHAGDDHVATGRERQQFHTGMALMLAAREQLRDDPDAAAQTLGRALASFAACGDEARQKACADRLREVRTRRTCWMCQREFPGEGTYYGTVEAYLTPFVRTHLESEGHDTSSVDVEGGRLVLCHVCRSVVDGQARALLDRRLPELEARITHQVEERISELLSQLQSTPR